MHTYGENLYPSLTNLKGTNEELAARVIETLGNQDIVVVHNKEVPGARDLFPTEYSSICRSDVTVYNANKAKVLLQIEVQSSPMREAVFKAIYGAANLLRLFRNSSTNCKEFIVFAIPKYQEKKCAVKIRVVWKDFHFSCTLEILLTVKDALREMKSAISTNEANVPDLPECTSINPHMLIHLSSDDLKNFGEQARQIESPFHMIIDDGTYIYKFLHKGTERENVLALRIKVLVSRSRTTPKYFVVPEQVFGDMKYHDYLFRYNKVCYGPLKRDQAKQHLRSLVVKTNCALTELHNIGIAHSDVHLPNICFDTTYNAVLIDLDRCVRIWKGIPTAAAAYNKGCMYKRPKFVATEDFNAQHMDYVQLGWIVAWVLSEEEKYHYREWEKQSDEIRDDSFISTLITEGRYDESKLEHSSLVVNTSKEHFSTLPINSWPCMSCCVVFALLFANYSCKFSVYNQRHIHGAATHSATTERGCPVHWLVQCTLVHSC